jgi:hypothetical protein
MTVIQIVRFTPKSGTDPKAFEEANARLHREAVPKLVGLQRREATRSAEGDWLVVMRWIDGDSARKPPPPEVAEASKGVMSMVEMSTLSSSFYEVKVD